MLEKRKPKKKKSQSKSKTKSKNKKSSPPKPKKSVKAVAKSSGKKKGGRRAAKIPLPSKTFRIFGSVFIIGYILFSLQSSFLPGMGLKSLYAWPWTTWHMFQSNVEYAQTLKATGYTAGGETVDIDLESMFEYVGGGHTPSLLFYISELFTELGREVVVKNRFCRHIAEKSNKQLSEDKRIVGVDLRVLTWIKNKENKQQDLTDVLSHRWHI